MTDFEGRYPDSLGPVEVRDDLDYLYFWWPRPLAWVHSEVRDDLDYLYFWWPRPLAWVHSDYRGATVHKIWNLEFRI